MKIDGPKIDRSSWDEIKIEGWFKAEIPPNWEVDDDDEIIIFDPGGFGELRVSMHKRGGKRGKKQRASDILSVWREELDQPFDYQITIFKRSRELLILSAEYTVDEDEGEMVYWRIFPIIGDGVSLDISYSCSLEDRDREEAIIEGIIDSIRITRTRKKVMAPLSDGGICRN